MSLAGRLKGQDFRVVVLMSDGECNEGSVWESAMFAPAHRLDNMIAIIDYNKWQATGRTNEILAVEPLGKKWEAFGWNCYEVDGHKIEELTHTLNKAASRNGKPSVIIAHTVKGKGVSFMEDDNNWHYKSPSSEEVLRAKEELGIL
jgi:transketolase